MTAAQSQSRRDRWYWGAYIGLIVLVLVAFADLATGLVAGVDIASDIMTRAGIAAAFLTLIVMPFIGAWCHVGTPRWLGGDGLGPR